MDNILLITNADIKTSAGNITLMMRRAEAIFQEFDCLTRFVVYKKSPNKNADSASKFYTIDYIDSLNALYETIKSFNPIMIILYGYKSGLLSKKIKSFLVSHHIKSKLVYDVQGAIEEKWEYASSIKGKIKYIPQYFAFKYAVNTVDSIFVVSEELKNNCLKKIRKKTKPGFFIINCGTVSVPSSFDIIKNRKVFRNKHNIPETSIVFTYSGYRFAWQKVDEIILEFAHFDKLFDNAFFCFFCNSDANFFEKLKKAFPKNNFLVCLLDKNDYLNSLQACDIGYILRDYKETNRVAFPNKFSDYLSSGMLIGLNSALPAPLRVLEKHNLLYLNTDDSFDDKIIVVNQFLKCRNQYLNASRDACNKELLYREQVKRELSDIFIKK